MPVQTRVASKSMKGHASQNRVTLMKLGKVMQKVERCDWQKIVSEIPSGPLAEDQPEVQDRRPAEAGATAEQEGEDGPPEEQAWS